MFRDKIPENLPSVSQQTLKAGSYRTF